MKLRIDRNHIHHFVHGGVDILQVDLSTPDYPSHPTYGIQVDITGMTTQAEVKQALTSAIQAKIAEVAAQVARDSTIRGYFDAWNWLEFDTDDL